MALNIVLLEPEIPANTGNIGRTCVAVGARLHLIEPLGFRLSEKDLKRAGMDYWPQLDVTTYMNYEDFLKIEKIWEKWEPKEWLFGRSCNRPYFRNILLLKRYEGNPMWTM